MTTRSLFLAFLFLFLLLPKYPTMSLIDGDDWVTGGAPIWPNPTVAFFWLVGSYRRVLRCEILTRVPPHPLYKLLAPRRMSRRPRSMCWAFRYSMNPTGLTLWPGLLEGAAHVFFRPPRSLRRINPCTSPYPCHFESVESQRVVPAGNAISHEREPKGSAVQKGEERLTILCWLGEVPCRVSSMWM